MQNPATDRYYFDICAPSQTSDPIGKDLQDIAQVRHEALRRAAGFALDIRSLEELGAIIVTVKDAAGATVMTVRLVCAIEVHHQALGGFAP